MAHHKVIIIGAGVSGCNAAKTLVENGIEDFLILEATNRIGGRAKTASTKYGYLEFGAQWMHGDEDNPLFWEMSKLGLMDYKGEHIYDDEHAFNMDFYAANGVLIDRAAVMEGMAIYHAIGDRIGELWKPSNGPIEDFKSKQFAGICEELKVTKERRRVYEALTAQQDKASGYSEAIVPNDRSYLINSHIYNECGGKNFVFVDGTESIITNLFLPTVRERVKLNTEAIKVNWSHKGEVVVETRDERLSADYVIVTASLGVLKKYHKQIFVPPLPRKKREAIKHLTFGVAEKFCFLFNKPFWTKEVEKNPAFSGYGFVYDEKDGKDIEVLMQGIIGSEATWWRDICSLNTSTTNPNVLILWLAGSASVAANKCSDDIIKQVVFTLLRFFTDIQVHHQDCSLIRTNWAADKFFLGSYSTITASYNTKHIDWMMTPVSNSQKPKLLFAGEAYHREFMSSLHGAYETGRQQAMKIVQYEESVQEKQVNRTTAI